MAASSQATASFTQPKQEVWQALQAVLVETKNDVRNADEASGQVEAQKGVSFFSWGEAVDAAVSLNDGGTQVEVRSTSRMPLTLIDWGKNRRNCEVIIDGLKARLGG